jgi:hypothetical protein
MLKENYDPDTYKQGLRDKLLNRPHADILPEYPVDRSPHSGDDKIRKRKPVVVRKVHFDIK